MRARVSCKWARVAVPNCASLAATIPCAFWRSCVRLIRLVLRPEAGTPEDATTLARYSLTQLRQKAQGIVAANDAQLGTATLAHLQETLARIDETLKAQLQRTVN